MTTWLSRRVRAAAMQSEQSGGFSLIEVIVALGLILFVMTSSVVFFVNSLHSSANQQTREAAISLADQAMEEARAVPPASLFSGRSYSLTNQQWTTLPAAAAAAKSESAEYWDSTATGASTVVLPYSDPLATTYVNKLQYTVNTALGECWVATTTSPIVCGPTSSASATLLYRVIVDVHWSARPGESCPSAGCDYVITTLRDPSTDPLFNSNGP